jgi:ribosome-associated protein
LTRDFPKGGPFSGTLRQSRGIRRKSSVRRKTAIEKKGLKRHTRVSLIWVRQRERNLALFHQARSEAVRPLTEITAEALTPAVDLLPVALTVLDDMKAEAVVDIDLIGKTSIADAMIIASGRSQRHVGAIADAVIRAFKDAGHGAVSVEGLPLCDWVLIDAGDLVVHVFRPEIRAFYNLEKIWGQDRPSEAAERARA